MSHDPWFSLSAVEHQYTKPESLRHPSRVIKYRPYLKALTPPHRCRCHEIRTNSSPVGIANVADVVMLAPDGFRLHLAFLQCQDRSLWPSVCYQEVGSGARIAE